MPHGGSRPGSGRPKGEPNKRTKARARAVKKAAKQINGLIPGAFEGDGHAFLMALYKDPLQPILLRLDAAKAALPFEKPRLSPANPRSSPAMARWSR